MTLEPWVPAKRRSVPRHPQVTTAAREKLACFPVTVLVFLVDQWERCLLLRRPGQPGWEVIAGSLRAGETIPEAAEREVETALGGRTVAVYLGVLDAFTHVFDANLPAALQVCVLMRYRGGEVHPGRGLRGAELRWWAATDLDEIDLAVPRARWDLLVRASDMGRALRDARPEEPPGWPPPDRWSPADEAGRWR